MAAIIGCLEPKRHRPVWRGKNSSCLVPNILKANRPEADNADVGSVAVLWSRYFVVRDV